MFQQVATRSSTIHVVCSHPYYLIKYGLMSEDECVRVFNLPEQKLLPYVFTDTYFDPLVISFWCYREQVLASAQEGETEEPYEDEGKVID
jgi:hypothetical protein